MEQRFVEIEGVRTRYLTAGSGPEIVLLHGIGDDAVDWQWVIPLLAEGFSIYAPDMPYTSGTDDSLSDFSSTSFARFTERFLSALGIERAVFVGHSMGGLTALRTALAYPERVHSLVLVGSAGMGRELNPVMSSLTAPFYGELAIALGSTPWGSFQRVFARSALLFEHPERVPVEWWSEQYLLGRTPGFLDTVMRALREEVDIGGQRTVLLDRLPELAMPVLIIWGDRDRIIPLHHGQQAEHRLQNSRLEIVPDSGHIPHIEQPLRVAGLLRPFIEGIIRT